MAPEGWDVEGVHYRPKDGVKASWSKTDMIKEIVNLIGLEVTDSQIHNDRILPSQQREIIRQLGAEPETKANQPIREDAKKIGDICGFETHSYSDSWNRYEEDQLWKILQNLKQVKGDVE